MSTTTTGTPLFKGLTSAETLLTWEVVLAIGALVVWWQFFSIHSGDADARARALRRTSDPELIRRMAIDDRHPLVRVTAVQRATDAALLARVAANDPDDWVRDAAVRKVKDPAVLTRVAAQDKSARVREVALERVDDQATLAALATSEPEEKLRTIALRKLTDGAALLQVAIGDKNSKLRAQALEKLTPQTLARAESQARDPQSALLLGGVANLLAATQRVPERYRTRLRTELLPLLRLYSEPLWTSRFGPLQALEVELRDIWVGNSRITGQDITLRATFARGRGPLVARWRNTAFLPDAVLPWLASDPAALAQLASGDHAHTLRVAAIGKLTDRKVLKQLADEDGNASIRAQAQERLRIVR